MTEKTHPAIAEKLVMIDFDGTITPWGPGLMGKREPFPGVADAIRELKARGYRIGIFTSRMSESWLLHEFGLVAFNLDEQRQFITDTLTAAGVPFDFITAEKIPAEVYMDDKAIGVSNDFPLTEAITSFLGGASATRRAYFAGLFDGEGTVSVYANNRRAGNSGGGAYGALRIQLAQKDHAPLRKLKDAYGGSIRTRLDGLGDWTANSKVALRALTEWLPYLIVKRKQAELAIEFQSLVRDGKLGNLTPLTDEEKSQRLHLIAEIKNAKREYASV